MKRFLIAMVLAIACSATAGVAAAPAGAEGSCASGLFCAYTSIHFNGVESFSTCSEGPHTLAAYKYSAKNFCKDRAVTLIYAASNLPIICMNPSGGRQTVEYNKIYVLGLGSRC